MVGCQLAGNKWIREMQFCRQTSCLPTYEEIATYNIASGDPTAQKLIALLLE